MNNIIFDEDGRLVMCVDVLLEFYNDNSGIMFNCADFYFIFYDLIKDDVEFCFGKEISVIVQDEYGVDVMFLDNLKGWFDFVIGVDGVNLKIRKMVFGEGFEKYFDVVYFVFIIKN